jgi:hypothetical protein
LELRAASQLKAVPTQVSAQAASVGMVQLDFIAGEENHSLAQFDLNSMKLLSVHQVGEDPDVLAFDPGLGRLYVSAVLQECNRDLRQLGQFHIPHAHTVSVDPNSHLVCFPLENIAGQPVLRVMRPADQ